MRTRILFVLLCIGVAVLLTAAQAEVTLKTTIWPEEGWEAGGEGYYSFTFTNDSQSTAKVTKWTVYWEIEGKPSGEQWGGDLDLALPTGKETVKQETGLLPVEVVNKSKPGNAVMAGAFIVKIEGKDVELPFRLEVPAAELPEKTEFYRGKFVGVNLMPSHMKTFKGKEKMLRWLDQAYTAMNDLTSYKPYNGKMVLVQETPRNPYWGNMDGNGRLLLNTTYIDETLQAIGRGQLPFGWLHEIGHSFDVLGKWYFLTGSMGPGSWEFCANWKVCYVFENIPDQSHRIPYKVRGKEILLTGREWVDAYFLFKGDPYLADPSRKWESMTGDELNSFFLRLVRIYGWEPFKRWYRTYDRFEKLGLKEPGTSEGTIQLIAAILCHETGADLVPTFQLWRMPVTREDVAAMNKKYPIAEPGE